LCESIALQSQCVGVPVTDELYDLVLFVVHSFVRLIATELYALKHHDLSKYSNFSIAW